MRGVEGLRISPSMVVIVKSMVGVLGGEVGVGSSKSSSTGERQTMLRVGALLLLLLLLLLGVEGVEATGVAGTSRSPNLHCRGWSERVEPGSTTPTTVPPPLTIPVMLGVAKGSKGR